MTNQPYMRDMIGAPMARVPMAVDSVRQKLQYLKKKLTLVFRQILLVLSSFFSPKIKRVDTIMHTVPHTGYLKTMKINQKNHSKDLITNIQK